MLKVTLKSLMFSLLVCGLFVVSVEAQRQPTSGETEAYRNLPCTDPWINFAYAVEFRRLPVGSGNSVGECNITLYNDGRWSSYLQLRAAVVSTGSELNSKIKLVRMNDGNYAVIFKDIDFTDKVGIVGSNAGALISKDGGSFANQGEAFKNINLSNNASNLISDKGLGITDPARVINGNGSTMQVLGSTTSSVQSAGAKKVITLRSGARIVIR